MFHCRNPAIKASSRIWLLHGNYTCNIIGRYHSASAKWAGPTASPPTLGELKIQRSLINALPGNINTQHFQDTRYEYDDWGNPELVTTYTEAGTGNAFAIQGDQTTKTCYGDFNWVTGACTPDSYHTYVQGMTNNLDHKIQRLTTIRITH